MTLHPNAKTTPYTREMIVDRVLRLGWAVSEARVREEVLNAFGAWDVVDLIENRECQDLSDSRNRTKPVKDLGVVLLGASDEVEFLGSDSLR